MNAIATIICVVIAVNAAMAAPGGSYGSSYSAPSYSAPSYSAPSYSAPSYSAPAYSAPSHSYSYPSPAPHVKCGGNILVGCHPSVASVPCQSYSPSYSAPSYSAPSYSSY